MEFSSIEGKVFQPSPEEEYGPIRLVQGGLPEELKVHNVIAEDSCGNYFLRDGERILFWDHETSEITNLAPSLIEFSAKCVEPDSVDLEEGQVESVWVDPEFAKEMGIEKKP
jgi:hypothetical protein